jgi:hypothetical protein
MRASVNPRDGKIHVLCEGVDEIPTLRGETLVYHAQVETSYFGIQSISEDDQHDGRRYQQLN